MLKKKAREASHRRSALGGEFGGVELSGGEPGGIIGASSGIGGGMTEGWHALSSPV